MIDIADITDGMRVVWEHVPRGGYGYVFLVDAVVVRKTPSGRVTIQVKRRTGELVERTVMAKSLRKPTG